MVVVVLAVAAVLALALLLAGFVLLITLAVFQLASGVVTPPVATLLTSMFLLLLILAIVAVMVACSRNIRTRPMFEGEADAIGLLALTAGRELSGLLRSRPYVGGLGTLVAGFAVGASPELRNALKRALFTRL